MANIINVREGKIAVIELLYLPITYIHNTALQAYLLLSDTFQSVDDL